jgi:hypothetical protein
MKPSSKEVFEHLSNHCQAQLNYYRYNTGILKVNEKYRAGRISALKYISELTWYYIQEEKRLVDYFESQIEKQMKLHECLEDTAYKKGLYDALKEILDYEKKCRKKGVDKATPED